LAPIVALCFLLGIYPQPILNASKHDIDVVANIVQARMKADAAPEPAAGIMPADPAVRNQVIADDE